MIDPTELSQRLADPESDRIERKPSLAQSKEIRQAICAFANDLAGHGKPGLLIVGLADDGACANLEIDDDLLRKLADIRGEGTILPMPVIEVSRSTVDGCEVAVVQVEPAVAPPVRFRGTIWVRVGPSQRTATPEEERRLAERRRAWDLPHDLRPVAHATLDDLDLELFHDQYLPNALSSEVLAENSRTLAEQLMSLRFVTSTEPVQPTVLGLLVAGRDPREFLPGAYVQFVRFAGRDLTDPIKDQKEIDGPLTELLRRLDEVIEAHIAVTSDFRSGTVEIRKGDYPIVALQQLARNAVLHRNYEGTHAPVRISWFDDRIEILSPGGPYGQVGRDNFGRPGITDYRNPHLAEAMKNLGYVQRFGLGIPVAREELEKNGNPDLEFEIGDSHVLVRMRTA